MISAFSGREKRNLTLFIISYVLNNLVSGILYDTYVNYLQEVSPDIAVSFWAFYGQEGYRTAYYIAAALYLVAALIVFFGLRKYDSVSKGKELQ